MAWVSPKVYSILSQSEEGKDIIEQLPDLTQEECQSALDEFFGEGGKGASKGQEYNQAKFDDEAEEERYKAIGDEEVSEKDYEDEDEEKKDIEKVERDVLFGNDEPPLGNDFDEYYNKAKEFNNYEKLKAHYDYIKKIHGEGSVPEKATKKVLDEMSKNFDQGDNHRIWNEELAQRYADGDVSHEESIVIDYLNGDIKSEQFYKEYFKMNREKRKKADELFDKYYPGSPAEEEDKKYEGK